MFTVRISLNISKNISTKILRREGNNNSLNLKYICDKMPESPVKRAKRVLKFERLSEKAYPPTRGSKLAAGYDLYSAYDYVIPAMGKEMIKTDISVAIPNGCYGRVAPRSGLAWKHFIDVGAGVIDEDYRGNVCVILFNFNDKEFVVKSGDRIAQLICEQIADTELVETKLDETQRSDAGFGSTGISKNNQ